MALSGSSPNVFRTLGMGEHNKKDKIARRHSQRGEFERASSLFRENLAWSKKTLGSKNLITLEDQDLLSFNLHELGQYEQAEALDRQTLQVRRKEQGNRHEDTLETQHNLAFNLFKVGRCTEAADLDRRTLKARENAQGLEDQKSLSSRHNLAASLQELKVYSEAADLNRETLKIRERKCKEDDDDLIASRHNLATNLHGLAQYEDAADLLQRNLSVLRKTRKIDDPQRSRNEQSLTINLNALSRIEKGEEDRKRDDRKRKQAWDTNALHEQKLLEREAPAKLKIDQESTGRNAGSDYVVTDRDRNRYDDSPRHTRTGARITAATHGSNNEESAGMEIQRSRSTNHKRRPRKEKSREELQISMRTEDDMSTRLGISKSDGQANTPGPISNHKRASSASEAMMPPSTRMGTASAPTIFFPPENRDADKSRFHESNLI